MAENPKPHVYVEGLTKDGLGPDAQPEYVTLHLYYDQKQARIELPVGAPLFATEPGTEVYRRDLAELLAALQEAAASPQGISWPSRR